MDKGQQQDPVRTTISIDRFEELENKVGLLWNLTGSIQEVLLETRKTLSSVTESLLETSQNGLKTCELGRDTTIDMIALRAEVYAIRQYLIEEREECLLKATEPSATSVPVQPPVWTTFWGPR